MYVCTHRTYNGWGSGTIPCTRDRRGGRCYGRGPCLNSHTFVRIPTRPSAHKHAARDVMRAIAWAIIRLETDGGGRPRIPARRANRARDVHFALDSLVVRAEGALEHREDDLLLARLDLLGRLCASAHGFAAALTGDGTWVVCFARARVLCLAFFKLQWGNADFGPKPSFHLPPLFSGAFREINLLHIQTSSLNSSSLFLQQKRMKSIKHIWTQKRYLIVSFAHPQNSPSRLTWRRIVRVT